MLALLPYDEVIVLVVEHVLGGGVVGVAKRLWLLAVVSPEWVWLLFETDILLRAFTRFVTEANRTLRVSLLLVLLLYDFTDHQIIHFLLC